MKKVIGIALVLALAVMLMPGAVFAGAPTDVDIKWGGGLVDAGGHPVNYGTGWLSGTATSDEAYTEFGTWGDNIMGEFHVRYQNVSHWGVDNVPVVGSQMNAHVIAGAVGAAIWLEQTRLGPDPVGGHDDPAPPGQFSLSDIYVENGEGRLAMYSGTTKFGDLSDYNWGKPGSPGSDHHFIADVDPSTGYYMMRKEVTASDGDWAKVLTYGSGFAFLNSMSAHMSPGVAKFERSAWSPGARFETTGDGHFEVKGLGTTEVIKSPFMVSKGVTFTDGFSIDPTDGTLHSLPGNPSLGIIADFTSGFSIDNYSITAK